MRSWLNALAGWQSQYESNEPEPPTREDLDAAFADPDMLARLGVMH
ncbi:MAG: hypothetical protein ACRC7C_14415 [Beijerinckiaceae bacterium]